VATSAPRQPLWARQHRPNACQPLQRFQAIQCQACQVCFLLTVRTSSHSQWTSNVSSWLAKMGNLLFLKNKSINKYRVILTKLQTLYLFYNPYYSAPSKNQFL